MPLITFLGKLLAIYNVLVFLANVGILAKNFRAAGEVLPVVRWQSQREKEGHAELMGALANGLHLGRPATRLHILSGR